MTPERDPRPLDERPLSIFFPLEPPPFLAQFFLSKRSEFFLVVVMLELVIVSDGCSKVVLQSA